MEFTVEDIKRHSFGLRNKKPLYTRKKSRVAFDLATMTAGNRGETIERMITEKLAEDYEHIVSSTQTKSTHPYDIDVTLDCGRKIRVEVKSAVYGFGKCDHRFRFQNIHRENFDYCIFVAVTPVGLRAFWASERDLYYNTNLGEYCERGYAEGRNLVTSVLFCDDWSGPKPTWYHHMEDFPF